MTDLFTRTGHLIEAGINRAKASHTSLGYDMNALRDLGHIVVSNWAHVRGGILLATSSLRLVNDEAERLKGENARLQAIVDDLGSQFELNDCQHRDDNDAMEISIRDLRRCHDLSSQRRDLGGTRDGR